MTIEHVLSVVCVSDIDTAERFYERLFGRPRDNNPMPSLVEWRVTDSGWLQVTEDAGRAGSGLVNLAVDDLAAYRAGLAERGLEPEEEIEANKGVRLLPVTDPDGNRITFVGNFRIVY